MMAEEQYTRCPGCKTVFRVTDAQLALRDGQVRCGHCRTVFDGTANLIIAAPTPRPTPGDEGAGPPTVTLRAARALDPAPPRVLPARRPRRPRRRRWHPGSRRRALRRRTARRGDRLRESLRVGPEAGARGRPRHSPGGRRRARRRPRGAGASLHFRDALAAHLPSTRPMLSRVCALAGCAIRPLRDVAALSIDASDLQADPAHRGLLILTATVRNRASYAIGYPHLELTLTDAQDQVVVRRALAPPTTRAAPPTSARASPATARCRSSSSSTPARRRRRAIACTCSSPDRGSDAT